MTIFSFTHQSNVFFSLSAQIDDSVASLVIAQLLFLQSESNNKPIHMYINSPGKTPFVKLYLYHYTIKPISYFPNLFSAQRRLANLYLNINTIPNIFTFPRWCGDSRPGHL